MNDVAKNARKSLEDLKKQLENAQPVYVDSGGRLTTPEEAQTEQENTQSKPVKIKPSRWF